YCRCHVLLLLRSASSHTAYYPLTLHDALPIWALTQHLLSLGHTQIGYIAGPLSHLSLRQRVEGFKLAMAEANDGAAPAACDSERSEEHTSELQSREKLVCRLMHYKKYTENEIQ